MRMTHRLAAATLLATVLAALCAANDYPHLTRVTRFIGALGVRLANGETRAVVTAAPPQGSSVIPAGRNSGLASPPASS